MKCRSRERFVLDSIGDYDGSCKPIDEAMEIEEVVNLGWYVHIFLSNLMLGGKSC